MVVSDTQRIVVADKDIAEKKKESPPTTNTNPIIEKALKEGFHSGGYVGDIGGGTGERVTSGGGGRGGSAYTENPNPQEVKAIQDKALEQINQQQKSIAQNIELVKNPQTRGKLIEQYQELGKQKDSILEYRQAITNNNAYEKQRQQVAIDTGKQVFTSLVNKLEAKQIEEANKQKKEIPINPNELNSEIAQQIREQQGNLPYTQTAPRKQGLKLPEGIHDKPSAGTINVLEPFNGKQLNKPSEAFTFFIREDIFNTNNWFKKADIALGGVKQLGLAEEREGSFMAFPLILAGTGINLVKEPIKTALIPSKGGPLQAVGDIVFGTGEFILNPIDSLQATTPSGRLAELAGMTIGGKALFDPLGAGWKALRETRFNQAAKIKSFEVGDKWQPPTKEIDVQVDYLNDRIVSSQPKTINGGFPAVDKLTREIRGTQLQLIPKEVDILQPFEPPRLGIERIELARSQTTLTEPFKIVSDTFYPTGKGLSIVKGKAIEVINAEPGVKVIKQGLIPEMPKLPEPTFAKFTESGKEVSSVKADTQLSLNEDMFKETFKEKKSKARKAVLNDVWESPFNQFLKSKKGSSSLAPSLDFAKNFENAFDKFDELRSKFLDNELPKITDSNFREPKVKSRFPSMPMSNRKSDIDNFINTISGIGADTNKKPKVSSPLEPVFNLGTDLNIETLPKPKPNINEDVFPKSATLPALDINSTQKQEQKSKQDTIQLPKFISVPDLTTPNIPDFTIPDEPTKEDEQFKFRFKFQNEPKKKNTKDLFAFITLVKNPLVKIGKNKYIDNGFSQIGSLLTEKGAFVLGAETEELTPGRTFKVEQVKISDRDTVNNYKDNLYDQLRQQFRPSNKTENAFVELSKYAINSPGEFAGITRKGTATRQAKGKSKKKAWEVF